MTIKHFKRTFDDSGNLDFMPEISEETEYLDCTTAYTKVKSIIANPGLLATNKEYVEQFILGQDKIESADGKVSVAIDRFDTDNPLRHSGTRQNILRKIDGQVVYIRQQVRGIFEVHAQAAVDSGADGEAAKEELATCFNGCITRSAALKALTA